MRRKRNTRWINTPLLRSDVIRVPLGVDLQKVHDGMLVGDAVYSEVRHLLARERISIERDGEPLEPAKKRSWATPRHRSPSELYDPWAARQPEEPLDPLPKSARRTCMVCTRPFLSYDRRSHRLCDRCRQLDSPFRG